MESAHRIAFDNSYARLPDRFFARLAPEPVGQPALLALNEGLARILRLDPDWLRSPEGLAMLAGNAVPDGAEPLAQAYAGHQFGGWSPQLGDGRAILLGEVVGTDGKRRDIQLKGSGPTPFSRSGDGRAWLGPVLREYIVSEAMHALGIPATRALAAVATGESVWRESVLPGAVFARVAASHIRVGTFQYFAARRDIDALKLLTEHALHRHYPDQAEGDGAPALRLLDSVAKAQARLIAEWMRVGFIHGVMNTDNMTISGETIDFGPCAFLDAYHPDAVFSSIDRQGRYAFSNQPAIAQWNLAQLGSSLLPLMAGQQEAAVEQAQSVVDGFANHFNRAYSAMLSAKLGLATAEDGDTELARGLYEAMAHGLADHTLTFRRLSALLREGGPATDEAVRSLFADPTAFDRWAADWRARLAREGSDDATRRQMMQAANPAYISRNHRIEQAIQAAVAGDMAPFHTLNAVLERPYEDQPDFATWQAPPRYEERVTATFCGT